MAPQVGYMDSHALAWPLKLEIRTPTLHIALFRVFVVNIVKGRSPLQKVKSNHPAITMPEPVCAQT